MEPDGRTLRLFYSVRDFALALSALDFFLEVDEGKTYSYVELRRFRCYLDEAVIAYCRPFTQGRGMPVLTFEDLGVTPTSAQRELHARLLAYRHKVVAHSDVERMRMLVRSIKPFDDRDLLMPLMATDEGLEFLSDRGDWEIWLRTLRSGLAAATFDCVQAAGEAFHLSKDFTTREDAGSEDAG